MINENDELDLEKENSISQNNVKPSQSKIVQQQEQSKEKLNKTPPSSSPTQKNNQQIDGDDEPKIIGMNLNVS